MHSLDEVVLRAARDALNDRKVAWLATVVAVHGSSPRPAGSMALFLPPTSQVGSLSGGCVEEEMMASLAAGAFDRTLPTMHRYGVTAEENARLGLPCGGHLRVLLQCLDRERDAPWLDGVLERLSRRRACRRRLDFESGQTELLDEDRFNPLAFDHRFLTQSFGPRQRMLLVGAGQLAASVAELALGLDYEVLVVDPRDDARADWQGPDVPLLGGMPDDAVRAHADDSQAIVITLTHDPRIDDMALMEALESRAWYVGALGSRRTTEARFDRLSTLGLSDEALARLHAPVGIDIGSKTPPEIAVSILAELTRLRRRGV